MIATEEIHQLTIARNLQETYDHALAVLGNQYPGFQINPEYAKHPVGLLAIAATLYRAVLDATRTVIVFSKQNAGFGDELNIAPHCDGSTLTGFILHHNLVPGRAIEIASYLGPEQEAPIYPEAGNTMTSRFTYDGLGLIAVNTSLRGPVYRGGLDRDTLTVVAAGGLTVKGKTMLPAMHFFSRRIEPGQSEEKWRNFITRSRDLQDWAIESGVPARVQEWMARRILDNNGLDDQETGRALRLLYGINTGRQAGLLRGVNDTDWRERAARYDAAMAA